MSGDIQKSLEIYQKQLKDVYIREAYITLTKYVSFCFGNYFRIPNGFQK
mgnify:FL=1